MRYVWQILRKDARGLRTELLLLWALAVLLAWSFTHFRDASWAVLTAAIGANFVIARLVHADAIAGEAPFWITRPYPPRSMLIAKLLFLVIFIQLPNTAVDIYVVASLGFSIVESTVGLLMFQVLIFLCAVIPVACLASVTSGLVEFLFAEVAAAGLVFLGFGLTYLGNVPWIPMVQPGPPAVDWVRSSVAAVVVAAFAAAVLFRQYTGKATKLNRLIATGGALTAALFYLFLPWTVELNLQTLISPGVEGTRMGGTLETIAKSVFPIRGRKTVPQNEVNLPILLHGIGQDEQLVVDALYMRLTSKSGREWSAGLIPVTVRPAVAGHALVNAELEVDHGFFADEASHPVSLRATLYLTVFGKARRRTIPVQHSPVRVMDGLQCSEGSLIELVCGSTFRWPQRLVSIESGNSADSITSLSYSPFPAGLGSQPLEARPLSVAWTATDVTIALRAPLAHVRTNITIPGIILTNFTLRAKLAHDRGVGINVLQ